MQLQAQQNKVVNRGVQEKYYYKVANTPKVMQMLGDMLYSDKVLAPIRELTTNAIDSHVVAGTTDKPIKYKLPSRFDETPTFTIRDFGEGIPEEKLIKLYRIYGLSDKDEDDTTTGCLGLGSKSPFCLSDSFTTISYHNKKKFVYVNSKSANGVPTLNKMGEFDTDEPNGVEISFPVKINDIDLFKNKLEFVLKRCPIPYECNIPLNIKKEDKGILLEGDNWKVFKGGGSSKAIMGYIEYPINVDQFRNNNQYSRLLEMPIELFFNIGEIEMDISREELQYNELTLSAIKKRLDEINSSLLNMMIDKINAAASLYDARILYEEFAGKFDWITRLNKFTWKNQLIKSSRVICEELQDPKWKECIYLYKIYGKVKFKTFINIYNDIRFNNDLVVFIDDLSRSARGRATQFLRNKIDNQQCLIITRALENEFLDLVGIPQSKLQYISSLPKVTKAPRVGNGNKTYSARKLEKGNKYIIPCGINKGLGRQYYLVMCRDNINFCGHWIRFSTLKEIANNMSSIGVTVPNDIYLVIPSKEDTVKKWKWKSFSDYAKSELVKKKTLFNKRKSCLAELKGNENALFRTFTPRNVFDKIPNGLFKKYLKFLQCIDRCSQNKNLAKLIELGNYIDFETVKAFDLNTGKELKKTKNDTKVISLSKIEQRVFGRYPLLEHISQIYWLISGDGKVINDMIEYVKLVDSQKV